MHNRQPRLSGRHIGSRLSKVATVVLLGTLLAACGSTASTNAGSTSGSKQSVATIAAAQSLVRAYSGVPAFPALGPSFDASKAAGKLIYIIPVATGGFNSTVIDSAASLGRKAGARVVLWPTTGVLSQYQQGVDAAINAHANLIDLEGVNPAEVAPQLAAARAKGIAITLSVFGSGNSTSPKGIDGGVNMPYKLAGELEAAYAIATTQGHVDAAVLVANDIPQTASVVAGVKEAFAKYCPNCSYQFVNEANSSWPAFASATAAVLLRHAGINYVIPIFDNFATYAVSGIESAGAATKVKIDSLNGTPAVLGLIGKGLVQMDVGVPAVWIGDAEMANDLRVLTGHNGMVVAAPPRVFDSSNVRDAGTPISFGNGYGQHVTAPFLSLLGLSRS